MQLGLIVYISEVLMKRKPRSDAICSIVRLFLTHSMRYSIYFKLFG